MLKKSIRKYLNRARYTNNQNLLIISISLILSISVLYLKHNFFNTQFSQIDSVTAENNLIYVSPQGNNTNPGTQNRPVLTIQRAVDLAAPGSTIIVENGVYYERVTISKSGTSTQPIKLRTNGNSVILDGATYPKNWQKSPSYTGNVYEIPSSADIGNLTWNNNYLLEVKKTSMSTAKLSKDFVNGPSGTWNAIDAIYGNYDKKVYLGFGSSQNPNSLNIGISPRLSGAITLKGASNIIIENFNIRNTYFGVYLTDNSSKNIVRNNKFSGNTFAIGIWNGANNNSVHNNQITLNYKHSLSPYTRYADFLWDQFKVLSTGDRVGIDCYKGGSHNNIYYNSIYEHFGGIYTGRGGSTYCSSFKVYGNTIRDILDDGLEPEGNVTNHQWYDNKVTNALQGIRIKEPVGGPMYVYNNQFITSQNRGVYYVATSRAQVYVYHNSIVRTPTKSLIAGKIGEGDFFSNSLFVNNIFIGDEFGQTTNSGNGVIFEHNGVITKSVSPRLSATNKVITDNNLNSKYDDKTYQLNEFSNTGIDISRPFTIAGKLYSPLPHLPVGYNKSMPNPGAYPQTASPIASSATKSPTPISSSVSTSVPTSSPIPQISASPVVSAPLQLAVNFEGPTLTVDGIRFLSESESGVVVSGNRFSNQAVNLVPTAPSTLAQLIRSSVWGNNSRPLTVRVPNLPNNTYSVYFYTWEDNNSQIFSISIENQEVLQNYTSGNAGNWKKHGPYRVTISDGALDLRTTGGDANLSALEIWNSTNTSASPISSPSPSSSTSTTLRVRALGEPAFNQYPELTIYAKDLPIFETFVTDTYALYPTNGPLVLNQKLELQDLKVAFTNDAAGTNSNGVREDRNLRVDYLEFNGVQYQSEGSNVYSLGSWGDGNGCDQGYKQSEWLHCSYGSSLGGFFQYRR